MKIAFVHEFLVQYGGAERVLESFLARWPEAPVYTFVYDKERLGERFAKYDIRPIWTSSLPAIPPAGHQWYLPLYPLAAERLRLNEYDVVLSDSSFFAKGIRAIKPTVHLSYIHTPTRHLWIPEDRVHQEKNIPWLLRPLVRPLLTWLKGWDYRAAQRPDALIANSEEVARRIQAYYERRADAVVYPPVTVERFHLADTVSDYWLLLGRLEAYKRPELAVQAATRLGYKLKVVGTGRMESELRKMAGPTVEFLGWQSDEKVAELLAGALGLLFPPLEDAGITPLEAMAAGRPVLAYGKGGALETVIPGKTGEFFAEPTVESLAEALSKFEPKKYNSKEIRKHAEQFDTRRFLDKIEKLLVAYSETKE